MPRPHKMRYICEMPQNTDFGPINQNQKFDRVIIAIDEFETIRLMDFEGLTQEECAVQMNVARTTVQRIYADARKKIADALVNNKNIKIQGGNFEICDQNMNCGRGHCHRRNSNNKF